MISRPVSFVYGSTKMFCSVVINVMAITIRILTPPPVRPGP
jgi:hypothetical protein